MPKACAASARDAGHRGFATSLSMVISHYRLLGSAPDLAECLWACHSLPLASVSPSVLWEPRLGGLWLPQSCGAAVGPKAPNCPGEQKAGWVSGWEMLGQPQGEGSTQPRSAHFSLLRAPNALRRLGVGISLLRRGLGLWTGGEVAGSSQAQVQVPLSTDKRTSTSPSTHRE